MKRCLILSEGSGASSPRRFGTVLWAIVALPALFVGCGAKNEIVAGPNAATNHPARTMIRSTAHLRQHFPPGIGTNEILTSLGNPSSIQQWGKGKVSWFYQLPPFPADDEMRGSYISGVRMWLTNGCLAYWGCSYTGALNDGQLEKEKTLPNIDVHESTSLSFFAVSEAPIPNGRVIDSDRFPKLGFITRAPALVITKLKEVTLKERVESSPENVTYTVWDIGLFLNEEDAARLESLTSTNVSKKLLVMVNDEPVLAATIMAPLETGSFCITCRDRRLMEEIKKQLEFGRKGRKP